jgi:hypothetical protein
MSRGDANQIELTIMVTRRLGLALGYLVAPARSIRPISGHSVKQAPLTVAFDDAHQVVESLPDCGSFHGNRLREFFFVHVTPRRN